MRVSPMVIANDYRHPVAVAREGATIDILSEGRFELGIGTGWIKPQYDSIGLSYDSPAVRVARFEEALQVILGCWSGEPFSMDGEHYQVDGVTCPSPVQRPHPPLLIAAAGKRMSTLAGRVADIVGVSPVGGPDNSLDDFDDALGRSASRIAQQVEWIRAGAGDRDIVLSLAANHIEATADVEATAVGLAEEWGTTLDQVLASPHVLLGDPGRIIETMEERREKFGVSYWVLPAARYDLVESVVTRIAGS
jgi:probable F420-dependent oxidoreductase